MIKISPELHPAKFVQLLLLSFPTIVVCEDLDPGFSDLKKIEIKKVILTSCECPRKIKLVIV